MSEPLSPPPSTPVANPPVPVTIFVQRGAVVNEWHRQEVSVYLGNALVKTLWLPLDWSDGRAASYLLFGVDKGAPDAPFSDDPAQEPAP